MKLPKQWRHWCADSRLRQHRPKASHKRNSYYDFYLKGRGHVWRLNCHNQFQRGDNYAEFDRWALCSIFEAPMPQTRAEFRAFVAAALADASITGTTP